MPKPDPGKYYIVNKAADPDGKTLAINYEGENKAVTVAEFQHLPTQVWILRDAPYDSQQISPQNATHLEIGWPGTDGSLFTIPAVGTFWIIIESEGDAIIQDDGSAVYWFLEKTTSGAPVVYGVDADEKTVHWALIPV